MNIFISQYEIVCLDEQKDRSFWLRLLKEMILVTVKKEIQKKKMLFLKLILNVKGVSIFISIFKFLENRVNCQTYFTKPVWQDSKVTKSMVYKKGKAILISSINQTSLYYIGKQ